jgi:hypothetical protein
MSQKSGKSYQIDRTIFVILDDLIRTKYPPIFCLFYFTINFGIRFDLYPFSSQASSIDLPKVFVVVLQTKNHGFNTQLHTLSFQDSPLLSLPAELRLQIYSYCLHDTSSQTSSLLSQYCSHNTWISPPISRTCSLLRNETLPLHYNTGSFVYDLRSPLEEGITCLTKVLHWLRHNNCGKLGRLTFKHVNKGILSMRELRKWTELFVEYADVLPDFEHIEFCGQALRFR